MPRDPHDSDEAAASTAPSSDGLARPTTATAARVLEVAASCASSGVRGAMATVLERHGSAPGTAGQKLYLGEDGTCVGTVGGGAIERETLETLRAVVADPLAKHAVRTFKLGAELGMCCGGQVEMLVEPIDGVVPCLVVGGGHVASAVAPLLVRVGFAVTVVDAREGWGDEGRIAGVRCVQGEVDDVGVEIDPRGVCLVMTHDHSLDQDAIEWALKRGFAFVGGVGSRAKAERTRQRLEAKGFPESDRARVRMPLGVDIGARLPDEIAVAIAAEMVAWRKKPAPRKA
jgi:xanthine dehydrogenase accessory factor